MSAAIVMVLTSDAAGSLGFGSTSCRSGSEELAPSASQSNQLPTRNYFQSLLRHTYGAPCGPGNMFCSARTTKQWSIFLVSRTSKVAALILLVRKLLLAAAPSTFTLTAQHGPDVHNRIADALTRFHWQELRCLAPEVHPAPVVFPLQQWEELTQPLSRQSTNTP